MSRGPFQPGDSCNRYKIIRSLGVGGFGQVYEAVREFKILTAGILQPFGQNVALKCLVVDQAGDPERIERLNLEAVMLLQMRHPNIVGFVDWGITDDGTAYFAMDLLHGKNLSQALKERRFSVARSIYVAAEIAEGMTYAHKQGVTHRDLKPGNVFVTDEWDIKVLDLGAAKYRYSFSQPTHSGHLAPCTITYAAPEQLRNSREVDGRADVFALGIIAYQMLTGHHPFCEDARTLDEQVHRQIECAAEPLTGHGIPDHIAEVVHRALAKKAEDRPVMESFRDDLRAAYSQYVGSGAYQDKGLVTIVERRNLRQRVQRGESDPVGVRAVKAEATTAKNDLPPINSGAPTKPVPDGFAPTDHIDVPASLAFPSAGANASHARQTIAPTHTMARSVDPDVAVVRARPRRFDGWATVARVYERTPNMVKLWAAGLMMLPLGLILAGWPRRGTAEVHADPKPEILLAPPAPVAPPVAEVEPTKPAPAPPPPATPATAPAPKARKSSLHGIHTPKWDAIGIPSKTSFVVPE